MIKTVHSPLTKQNVDCSNGYENPAMTEFVTLETDVSATNAWNMAMCLMPTYLLYVTVNNNSVRMFSLVEHVLSNKDEVCCTMIQNIIYFVS